MRVVIVAPGTLAAETLQSSLRTVPPLEVLGFADSRRLGVAEVAAARPDVIVIDGRLGDEQTLGCVERLRQAVRTAKIIMVTAAATDEEWLAEACGNGLDAAVSASVGSPMLGSLVRHIAQGSIYHRFAPTGGRALSAPQPFDMLTARELEILRLVAGGASNGQVAATLWVTEQTVKFHLSNVYRKLQVANRTEASHYAYVNGLLDDVVPVSGLSQPAPAAAVAA